MTSTPSRTAEIRRLSVLDEDRARLLLADLVRDLFGLHARNIVLNNDRYSLNSLNGVFDTDQGRMFFKFHQEEGEEAMSGEYYRAGILAEAGLPVDQPVFSSTLPGEQILIYTHRNDRRFSDVLRALDLSNDLETEEKAVDAERRLSDKLLDVYLRTLAPATAEDVAAEPIHRLFHERLTDPGTGSFPGGRLAGFYVGKTFSLADLTLDWAQLASTRFVINGVAYERSIGQLFAEAFERLDPRKLADAGGVVAHGDAHNANVWYVEQPDGTADLSFFDPAFAGRHVPTLLAEVKTTFHNVFAHPLWLYDPAEAATGYWATARLEGNDLVIATDHAPSRVRRRLLEVKASHLWRPLLKTLSERGMLPADWRRVVRLALFLCPTLVMNLRSGAASHNPVSSLIGFSHAVMVGSEPCETPDIVSGFLDSIDPGRD